MTNRELYQERKAQALSLMTDDYDWLMQQPMGSYEWLASKKWLVEWVYDVGCHRSVRDELLRPIPLSHLYAESFEHLGLPAHHQPSTLLSKLKTLEQRHDISPDYVTLFYMNHLDDHQASPSSPSSPSPSSAAGNPPPLRHRIIELLLRGRDEKSV